MPDNQNAENSNSDDAKKQAARPAENLEPEADDDSGVTASLPSLPESTINDDNEFFEQHFSGDMIGIGKVLHFLTNGNMWDAFALGLIINIIAFIPMAYFVWLNDSMRDEILHFWHQDRVAYELYGVFIALPGILAIYIWQADGIRKALTQLTLKGATPPVNDKHNYHQLEDSMLLSGLGILWAIVTFIAFLIYTIVISPIIFLISLLVFILILTIPSTSKIPGKWLIERVAKWIDQWNKWRLFLNRIFPDDWKKPRATLNHPLLEKYIRRQHISYFNDVGIMFIFSISVALYIYIFLLSPETTVLKEYSVYWWEKSAWYMYVWAFFTFLGMAMITNVIWHHYALYRVIIKELDRQSIDILYYTANNGFKSVSQYFGQVSWLVVIVGIFIALQAGFPSAREVGRIFTNQSQTIIADASPFIVPTVLYFLVIIVFISAPIQTIRRHMREVHQGKAAQILKLLENKRDARLNLILHQAQASDNDPGIEEQIVILDRDIKALILEKERIDADDITWPFSASSIWRLTGMFSFPILLPTILEIIGIAVEFVN